MIGEIRHVFPLGDALARPGGSDSESTDGAPGSSAVVPFGLRYATAPTAVRVDMDSLDYDQVRQIAVVRDGCVLVPALKHTSTVNQDTH